MGRKVAKNLIVCLFVLDEAVYKYKIKTIKTKFKKKGLVVGGWQFLAGKLQTILVLLSIVCLYMFEIDCLFVHILYWLFVCTCLPKSIVYFPPSKVGLAGGCMKVSDWTDT